MKLQQLHEARYYKSDLSDWVAQTIDKIKNHEISDDKMELSRDEYEKGAIAINNKYYEGGFDADDTGSGWAWDVSVDGGRYFIQLSANDSNNSFGIQVEQGEQDE